MLAWLGRWRHLSYEKQQEWLRKFGQIEVGIGTLEASTRRVAQTVSPQVKALQAWIQQQPQVHVDESPWLVGSVKEWMWMVSGEGYGGSSELVV